MWEFLFTIPFNKRSIITIRHKTDILTVLVSVMTGIAVRQDVAMTGEITLRGRVLPIGGLKEKSLAAYRAGIKVLIIPKENEKDLEEIPPHVLSQFRVVTAETIEDVLKEALVSAPLSR